MTAAGEEHSERNEVERGEDSDTEKMPEHKSVEEVGTASAAEEAASAQPISDERLSSEESGLVITNTYIEKPITDL